MLLRAGPHGERHAEVSMVELDAAGSVRRGLSRRTMLSFAAALALGTVSGREAKAERTAVSRIVALDAPSAEMLVQLGVGPAGVAGLEGYRQAAGDVPALRQAVDIGFFYEPNLELLQALAPDVFVSSFGIGAPRDLLERIAPLISLPIYGVSSSSYEAAILALTGLAEATGREEVADAFLVTHRSLLDETRTKAQGRSVRPVYLATPLLDGRHVILYGKHSLFEEVMKRVGLRNAFVGETTPWGIASVGIDQLAQEPEAVLLYIESPVTQTALKGLDASAIWRSLPFVREQRLVPVPYLEMYGALPTADRFLGMVGDLLDRGALDAS